MRPASAAKNGPVLISTSVFATVVCVTDRMKKKNVAPSARPDQTPGIPDWTIFSSTRPRFWIASTTATKTTMNTERQKTISHGSRRSALRTRMPPVLQQKPAAIISTTPFRRSAAVAVTCGAFRTQRARFYPRRRANWFTCRCRETQPGARVTGRMNSG